LDISVKKLLVKMEQELLEAKSSGSISEVRERIHAIKTLCELLLDHNPAEIKLGISSRDVVNPSVQTQSPAVRSVQVQPKKIQIDDESNGDSLFDF